MSKNYELLQRIERESALFSKLKIKSSAGLSPHRTHSLHDERDKQLTKVVDHLIAANFRNAPRVVAFADVDHQNGSTWICSRTAELLAKTATVCVLDANFHSPGVHTYFGLDNTAGLTNLMDQECQLDQVVQTATTGPSVITAGVGAFKIDTNAADVLSSIFSTLRNQFDYVLLDAPPIHSHSQAPMLSALAEGVILVVQANITKRDEAVRANQELQDWDGNVIGSILNNQTFPIPEKIYRKLQTS